MCHKSYKSHAPHKISLVNIFTVVTLTTVALGPIKQKQNNIDLLRVLAILEKRCDSWLNLNHNLCNVVLS